MEPFAKAKRRAFGVGISHEQERPCVVVFQSRQDQFGGIYSREVEASSNFPDNWRLCHRDPVGSVALIGIAGGATT
jgi:hypothetical protein